MSGGRAENRTTALEYAESRGGVSGDEKRKEGRWESVVVISMPEPPASSHLLEGKRGAGGGRGGPATAAAVISSVNNISTNSVVPESTARERDRGGGGGGDRRRDDLTTPMLYSASDIGTVPTTASCDAGRSIGGGVPFIQGSTPSSSNFGQEQQQQQQQSSGVLDLFPAGGMDVTKMQQQLSEYTDTLFFEGLLDDQFTQLQLLQDDNNPEFVSEVVSLFFEDSEKLLEQLTESLETDPIDYKKVDAHVHQFKGSSSSIGAQRVKTACITFRACCEEESKEGCRQALAQVKQEFYLVKSKLEAMLALEQRLLAAGGTLPFME